MRHVIMVLSFAALSACATTDQDPAAAPEQGDTEQTVCADTWECWCNQFSTREACNAASTPNGWHCYWAGPLAAERSRGLCHATHE